VKDPAYDLRRCSLADVRALCIAHHGYRSAGNTAVYAFGVYEDGRIVAAYAWQPPPPGAARSVCPEAPYGVLALSRMVAVPREERALRHVSRPPGKGVGAADPRDGWPHFLRLARIYQLRAVLAENVAGLTHQKHRPYLEHLAAELEALGYVVPRCPNPAGCTSLRISASAAAKRAATGKWATPAHRHWPRLWAGR